MERADEVAAALQSYAVIDPPSSILVVKPSSLGDIVHTLPAVALIRKIWPEARLQWLVNSEWAPLIEGNPYVDATVDFPRRSFRGLAGSISAAHWSAALQKNISADLVLDFQGLLRSALLSKLGRAEQGRIFGLSDAREGARLFYDEIVDVSGKSHAVDRYLAMASALGAEITQPLEWPLPTGTPPDAEVPERFVLLHPYSRGVGKSLTAAEVERFCQAIAPIPVVLAGVAKELPAAPPGVFDLVNKTSISELIWLLRRAAFVVSVDSGPMHIAAALTSRLLSIHTWSDPRRVGPYQEDAWVWKKGELCQVKELESEEGQQQLPEMGDVAEWVAGQV